MIQINNLTENQIDQNSLEKVIKLVLKEEKIQKDVELSVALIGPGRMRKLNKKYKKKNRVTDILSFPESKIIFEKFKVGSLAKTKGLGEIVICSREVKKSAKKQNSSFEKELIIVLIHGILHLLGYDHERNEQEAEKMRNKEQDYIEKLVLV